VDIFRNENGIARDFGSTRTWHMMSDCRVNSAHVNEIKTLLDGSNEYRIEYRPSGILTLADAPRARRINNCLCSGKQVAIVFKSLKKTVRQVLFFLQARKYTEKRTVHTHTRSRIHVHTRTVATIRLYVDTMCNFIIFFRLESLTRHGNFE